MTKNKNLHSAKINKNDEFYTQLSDIEKEILMHKDYARHLKNKIVLCNCDDPEQSNFVKFFKLYFKQLGLKKLIVTHYKPDGSVSYKLECLSKEIDCDSINMIKISLKGNGDFASKECIELLKEADIVVSNPPFSLFKQYVELLMRYNKKFIIIGNKNAITYKDFFKLLKENKVWVGYNLVKEFKQPDGSIKKFGNVGWYTNLDIDKRHKELPLRKIYKDNEEKYLKYDNYDAIEIPKIIDIPKDYYGHMGVPITFMDYYNPNQFEIINISTNSQWQEENNIKEFGIENLKKLRAQGNMSHISKGMRVLTLTKEGKIFLPYNRIIIKRKQKENEEINL